NSNNYLDLKGENIQVKRLPTGFTARGIVALVFSCIAAFLGIAAIAYYGMNDIEDVEERVARDLDVDLDEENEDEEEAEIVNEGSSSSGSNSKQH
ncbi:iron transport multicopper oxidase FET3, partial [Candida albicans P78048]